MKSAAFKRRGADIRRAWAFIRETAMHAYVSGYDRRTRRVLVTPLPISAAQAQDVWNQFVEQIQAVSQ